MATRLEEIEQTARRQLFGAAERLAEIVASGRDDTEQLAILRQLGAEYRAAKAECDNSDPSLTSVD